VRYKADGSCLTLPRGKLTRAVLQTDMQTHRRTDAEQHAPCLMEVGLRAATVLRVDVLSRASSWASRRSHIPRRATCLSTFQSGGGRRGTGSEHL